MKDCPVTKENGPRPAGKQTECFYCHKQIGEQHEWECVLRERRVIVRMTTEYEIDVQESWTKENIEFHRNDSSWCATNALDELVAIYQDSETKCMCPSTSFEYIREAE